LYLGAPLFHHDLAHAWAVPKDMIDSRPLDAAKYASVNVRSNRGPGQWVRCGDAIEAVETLDKGALFGGVNNTTSLSRLQIALIVLFPRSRLSNDQFCNFRDFLPIVENILPVQCLRERFRLTLSALPYRVFRPSPARVPVCSAICEIHVLECLERVA